MEWVIQICVCSAAVAIAENIMPEGGIKKAVYFVLGLLVVGCFLSPIKNFEWNIAALDDIDAKQTADSNNDWFNRITENEFKKRISDMVKEELSRINVSAKKIDVHTDIDSEGRIFIDKVRVTVSQAYAQSVDTISDRLYEKLGVDADIIVR